MYNELYRAWKSEKDNQHTQPLPNDFYQRAETYLHGLKQEMAPADDHSPKASIARKEVEVATRLLLELRGVRLRKLLALAQSDATESQANLTEEETRFVEEVERSLETFNQQKLIAQGTGSSVEQTTELSVVRFLQDIPEIVGTDLKMYGPYKKEDVGSLPLQNAKALERQGLVKEVHVRTPSASTST